MTAERRMVLSAEGLHVGYGRVSVLRGVSLQVAEGELVAIIGANGAGKSTLLKALAGLLMPASGTVHFFDRDITRLRVEKSVHEGLVLVPEGRRLFGPMTVEENLQLGSYTREASSLPDAFARVYRLFPVLQERHAQLASTLSGGEQQMLAVGRALMADPKLLLLDEPSLGLAPKVVREIFAALDQLREQGMTILLVEQDARLALKHADRGYVMRTGGIALTGPASELLADDDVRLIYLGAWHGEGEAR